MNRLHSWKICAGMAALLLFAACSQDEFSDKQDTLLPEGVYPLEIASVTLNVESSEQPWNAPQTRVSENGTGNGSVWNNGDKIKVQIGNGTPGTYTYQGGNLTVAEGDVPAYWESSAAGQTITAWYPEEESINLANQSNGLVYVLRATTQANFNAEVSLPFEHFLSKIRVKLTGEKKNDVNTVQVKSYTTCTHNKGTVSGSSDGWITMKECTYDGTKCWEANVVPGTGIKDIQLNGSTPCTFTPFTSEVGKMHEITITVKQKVTEVDLSTLEGPYTISQDGKYILTGTTDQRIIINANAIVTLNNVNINTGSGGAPIQISGYHTATLILEGENKIQSTVDQYPAILPDQKSTVEINGSGSLKAQGAYLAAGIGAGGVDGPFVSDAISAGYIKISGGTVEAIGGIGGTGIGCGYYGNCQGIEISGGNVTAKAGGGYTTAAIGSAMQGRCNYVKLENCTINAHPNTTSPVAAQSVSPVITDSDALKEAGVTLNVN